MDIQEHRWILGVPMKSNNIYEIWVYLGTSMDSGSAHEI